MSRISNMSHSGRLELLIDLAMKIEYIDEWSRKFLEDRKMRQSPVANRQYDEFSKLRDKLVDNHNGLHAILFNGAPMLPQPPRPTSPGS